MFSHRHTAQDSMPQDDGDQELKQGRGSGDRQTQTRQWANKDKGTDANKETKQLQPELHNAERVAEKKVGRALEKVIEWTRRHRR